MISVKTYFIVLLALRIITLKKSRKIEEKYGDSEKHFQIFLFSFR